MKPELLILFALATTLPLALAAKQVVDTNGHPIIPGHSYYVLPATRSMDPPGGGLTLGQARHSKCPAMVLQEYSEIKGIPVKFSINEEENGMIFTGTPLDIDLEVHNIGECANRPTKWLMFGSMFDRRSYVGIGFAADHPDQTMDDGVFKIETHGRGYKLVFCPYVTIFPPNSCYDVATSDEAQGRLLLLLDQSISDPYEVVFQKE